MRYSVFNAAQTNIGAADSAQHAGDIADDDGAGYHVETFGGGVFTAVAWYASKPDAMRERERILAAGSWRGMPPRVVAGTRERGKGRV